MRMYICILLLKLLLTTANAPAKRPQRMSTTCECASCFAFQLPKAADSHKSGGHCTHQPHKNAHHILRQTRTSH